MFKKIFLLSLISFSLFTETLPQITAQLDQAEKDYKIAKNMFNPWYGSPLITASGNVMPPKFVNIYSLLVVSDTYAINDSQRKRINIPDVTNISPVINIGVGIIPRLDASVTLQGIYTSQSGQDYFDIGDTTLNFGIAILREKPYVPALKMTLSQSFPTGNYEKFEATKAYVSSTGSGAYATTIGFATSKVVWWWVTHPMQFRFNCKFQLFSDVDVEGINSYGGGIGTDGTVSPGTAVYVSGSYEFSVTQHFVLALDLAYDYHDATTFTGTPGFIALGVPASVGSPSKHSFSLAPAMEYVFNPKAVLTAGVWLSAYKTANSRDFIAGFVSFSYGF